MLNITSREVQAVEAVGTKSKRAYVKAFAHPTQAALCGLTSLSCGEQMLTDKDLAYAVSKGIFHPQSASGVVNHDVFVCDREDGANWVANSEYAPDYLFRNLPLTPQGAEKKQGITFDAHELPNEFLEMVSDNGAQYADGKKAFSTKVINPLNVKGHAQGEWAAESLRVTKDKETGLVCIYKTVAKKRKPKTDTE